MSAVPPVSRRVLDALHPTPAAVAAVGKTTPVGRAFIAVEATLDAHAAALATLDRIEAAMVATHGYPRVPLPGTGTPPTHATDAATIARRLGGGWAAHRVTAELRRRQATYADAARAAGLDVAQAREMRTAEELSAVTSHLLLAPAQTRADLALKLAVLIAAGEATADDALAFPWMHLRALHTDLCSSTLIR